MNLGQYSGAGCSIAAAKDTFNTGFNQAGGGVFAMEWEREKFIRVWNFVKPNIPADIVNVGNFFHTFFIKIKWRSTPDLG
jgi:hypothetical protein